MKWIGWTGVIVFVFFSYACSAADTKRSDGVDIWLAKICPTKPGAIGELKEPEEASSLGEVIFGGLLEAVVDEVGSALTKAAEADKKGRAKVGQSPAYLFESPKNTDSENYPPYYLPGCAVIAYTDAPPRKWCEEDATFPSEDMCKMYNEEKESLWIERLLRKPDGSPERVGDPGRPLFYAEIELKPSRDNAGLLPRLQALYYPKSLHNDRKFRGSKPRSLSIKITGTTPGGETAVGAISIILKGISPSPELLVMDSVGDKPLRNVEPALWVAVKAPPKTLPNVGAEQRYVPVNLRGEVREIGDENKFLQAIARAFDSNKAKIDEELGKVLIPSEREAASTTKELEKHEREGEMASALSAVYAAQKNLEAACSKLNEKVENAEDKQTVKAPVEEATVLQAAQAMREAISNLRKTEISQGVTDKTTFPKEKSLAGKDAKAICGSN